MEASPDQFLRDDKLQQIVVEVFENGAPCVLSGTVSVFFIKPNGETVEFNQNGSISGNIVTFAIPDSVYASNGPIQLAIRLIDEGRRVTIACCKGYVYPTKP